MKENKKLTIYDIAKLTGFSPKTVSRVVNGGESVKKSTYDIIQKALKDHNYVPNAYAKNLTNKTSNNVLLSVQERKNFPLNWFYMLLERVIVTCKDYNMNVIVEYYNEESAIETSMLYTASSFIDATVIFYEQEDDRRIQLLKRIGTPFLVFGKSATPDVVYVTNDDTTAMQEATDYLLEKGLKRIQLLMGGESLVNQERVNGAKISYDKSGVNPNGLQVKYGLARIEDLYRYGKEQLDDELLPDAIFVSGDEKIMGLLKALNEKGIKIPEDVSLIGFDDIPLGAYMTPALTTIAQDYESLAYQIARKLDEMIKGKYGVESVEVPTKLVIRDSVQEKRNLQK